jgi:chemotaxis signal transduction protein
LKGLTLREKNYKFLVDIKNVLHIAPYKEVEKELDDFKVVNFGLLFFDEKTEKGDIIFIEHGEKIVALQVEKVESIENADKIIPFEKELFMVKPILGAVKSENNETCYLIDVEKIIGAVYEL